MITPIITFYSIMLFLGGIYGYYSAGSLVSLILSGVSALLLMGTLTYSSLHPLYTKIALSVLTGGLTLLFLVRFIKTGALFPAATFLILSIIVLLFLLLQIKK